MNKRNETNVILVKYLVAKGELIKSEGKYGDDVDRVGTQQAKSNIDKYLQPLKWSLTEAPKTNNEPEFNGTYEESSYVTYLKTTLVFGKRRKELWKLRFDTDINLYDLIEMVMEYERE